MKFTLTDFLELDTKALLTVNGGASCSGGSCSSGASPMNKYSVAKYPETVNMKADELEKYKTNGTECLGTHNGVYFDGMYYCCEGTDFTATQVQISNTQNQQNYVHNLY